jgi:hypothetical protein
MVILAIELHKFCFKVCGDTGKNRPQIVKNLFREYFTAVFCYEHQMNMH